MASRPRPAVDEAPSIRRAEPADARALVRMLVRAYMDDPVATWMCGSERLRARTLAGLYAVRLRQMQAHREIWTNEELSSAAVWLPPGAPKAGMRPNAALLRCLLDPRLTVRAPLLAVGLRSMERAHPQEPPHWYLSLLGTDPEAQGSGFGSAVLQPVLARCDRDNVGAYLESSKPRNLDFYARHGFRTTGELKLPGGPTMWPMWRNPQ